MEMRATATSPTISTFSVTKGGKVSETYACFAAWDLGLSLDENLARFREANPILSKTSRWLHEIRKIFHTRFSDIGRHRPLIRLAQAGFPKEKWAPILLWHLCFKELLLSDFLETWLYPRKEEGMLRVRSTDVRTYIAGLAARGLLDRKWSENTISKMSTSLSAYAADFGLLRGKATKEMAVYHPPQEALLYILHDLSREIANGDLLLGDTRWRRLLLSRSELEQELLRMHQHRQLRFDTTGSTTVLELPFKTTEEYVEHLVRS
jgi:hypothetical protein